MLQARRSAGRRRALIINCYFDDSRQGVSRSWKIPQAMGPAYLAGAFAPLHWDLRLYSELASGPLEEPHILGWPDMLVLTGLTTALDRMLHVTAYARTRNPKVVVVAGGPAIRMMPEYCRQFFDYCCDGDIEQMREVIAETFGPEYTSEEMLPRFDLAYWNGWLGHVESSRYCNFRCSFCTLTAEGRGYQKYDLTYIRRQIAAAGRKELVLFIDNNFYGNDREFFLARMELLQELRQAGCFRGWAALVTEDFFLSDQNLARAREAGCVALFSGVESFDADWLRRVNKLQNYRLPQTELIRKCLEAGIVFLYGLMLDFTKRPIAEIRRELEYVTGRPEITLPSYVSAPIPMLGTPFFHECVANHLILPKSKVRDLDGSTLSLRPLDSIAEVSSFLRDVQTLAGFRRRVLTHSVGFYCRYRRTLTKQQMGLALANGALLCADHLATGSRCWRASRRKLPRTYVSTTEGLDSAYRPAFRVDSRYEHYFRPTMLTDCSGRIRDELAPDLSTSGLWSKLRPRGLAYNAPQEPSNPCWGGLPKATKAQFSEAREESATA